MKKVSLLMLGIAICLSCTSVEKAVLPTIDEVVVEAADRAVSLLPSGDRTLAVYYFTSGSEESDLSDYLINTLTTEIANRAGGNISIVSRQALDRIMDEFSYQLTDLVDQDEQVAIGKQLGADLILTGFIDPALQGMKLNMQLIEVETTRVLGGFIRDFDPSGYSIAAALAEEKREEERRESVVSAVKRELPRTEGIATYTTVFEDFETEISDVPLYHFEEHYGERVTYVDGKVETVQENGEGFARYTFYAGFEHLDMTEGWDDSDAVFYLNMPLIEKPEGYDGLSVSLRPVGFSVINIVAKQHQVEDTFYFHIDHMITSDIWNKIKIPWSVLEASESSGYLDYNEPIELEFSVIFAENHILYHFHDELEMAGILEVDDIGFYAMKAEDHSDIVENYEDEITRLPFSGEMYGSTVFMDYYDSDEGVLKENTLVNGQSLVMERIDGGPAGRYLRIAGELDITEGDYVPELALYLRGNFATNWRGYDALTLLMRSDVFGGCSLDFLDLANGFEAYADASVQSGWSRLRIPIDKLNGELESLGEDAAEPVKNRLIISFELPQAKWQKAVKSGTLEFNLEIDEIILEKR